MISICAPTFDLSGQLVSPSGFALAQNISRRAQRVAVLDLDVGAVLVDGGYSATDLTYQLTIPDDNGSAHQTLTELIATYPSLILACDRGCYLVLLSDLSYDSGKTTCTADVLEDLG